jgi:hypothetical protein
MSELSASDELFDAGTTDKLTFDYLKILPFGAGGVGKNWFSETFPNPMYMNLEHGLIGAKIRKRKFPYITPKKWAAVQAFFADPPGLMEKYHPGYKTETIVFDSLTFMGNTTGPMMRFIMAQKDSKKAPYPTITEFGRVTDKLRGFFALVRELPYHVVIISQEYTERDEMLGSIDTKPSMIGQMRNECINWVDVALWQTIEIADDGEPEYVGYPRRVSRNLAKDRLGVLPQRMVNPSFQMIWNSIQTAMKEVDQ